jgi:asparagine synthase (glutamine-hydrolysing)
VCGIFGLASVVPHDRTYTRTQRDTLAHRGPDDAGEWWSHDGRVGLFHRRLAIIDLTADANQPMQYLESPYIISFNGEIYNFRELRADLSSLGYRFSTQSDTEVILAAFDRWGSDCVRYLKGAFAFALFDSQNKRLLLARDRAGEKPLFYLNYRSTLYFASELKALLADPRLPRAVNATALDCYLCFGYVPHDLCILSGYNKLPAGHTLTFDTTTGRTTIDAYWQLPELETAVSSEADLIAELETLLEDAVARQLVADVPIGVLLSGGLDSSLIVAMAARRVPRIKTFNIRFPGHGDHDETEHARFVAKAYNTDHVELSAEEETAAFVTTLAHHFDEPIADTSMIPAFLVASLARQHCTVVLGGDGGDELFGGYRGYNRLLRLQSWQSRLPETMGLAMRWAAGTALRVMPSGVSGRGLLQQASTSLSETLPSDVTLFDRRERNRLLSVVDFESAVPQRAEAIWQTGIERQGDLVQRATRHDFKNRLPDDYLVKIDRASMARGLEVRVPFLDVTLVEFAYGKVASGLKATQTERKRLLKALAKRILPAGFDVTRKQGFAAPLASWLRGAQWSDLVDETLTRSTSEMLDQRSVRRVLQQQRHNARHSQRVFALLMLELWRRRFSITM